MNTRLLGVGQTVYLCILLHPSELRQELCSELLIVYMCFILFKLLVVENLASLMTESSEVRRGLKRVCCYDN